MGARSRRKGAGGEREFAALAREVGFPQAKRTAPMQAGGYAPEYGDVSGVPFLYIEAKRYRSTPVNRFARECLGERPGLIPVLAWRDDGQPWRVALDGRELLKLVRELVNLRRGVAGLRAELERGRRGDVWDGPGPLPAVKDLEAGAP